jgi:hypothetical protein
VTLSLYRNAERTRRVEIEVTVPPSETDVTVQVTMQGAGSAVEWTYVSYVCSSEMGRTQLVTVEFPDSRDYVCFVYLNGTLDQRMDCSFSGGAAAENRG